jgi:glyoxylase-like metal-dependent hydrolase (beta-lactamase superfamily II)
MRIHHLNCGTYCTRSIPVVMKAAKMCTHCLVIETNEGLVLVDSGYSETDLEENTVRSDWFSHLFAKFPTPEESLKRQLKTLGFNPSDVRHIVVTHMDPDHIGGVKDFPQAQVHLYTIEYFTAMRLKESNPIWKYRLRGIDWTASKKWKLYDTDGDRWNGLECIRPLQGIKTDVALVPLMGHTPGHCGILIQGDQTILHAGDMYYHASELEGARSQYSAFSAILAFDNKARLKNLKRLAEIEKENPGLELFSAHDYERWLHRHTSHGNRE